MVRSVLIAVALGLPFVSPAAAQLTERIVSPAVPSDIAAPGGFKPFLVGHAVGTQNYICTLTPTGLKWLFIGPQATIFDRTGHQSLTHFQSVNPGVDAIQATWQHSRDTSAVWARRLNGSSDPHYVSPDAIEWLLLEVTGGSSLPESKARLLPARYIQRINTVGGKEPTVACTDATLNQRQLVPYEADYVFFRQGHASDVQR
jgi:hypothetical protein